MLNIMMRCIGSPRYRACADSAQQIIAEVSATAATFPSPKDLASWMGACPGNEESAGVNYSHRCPKGNRRMRRVLNQAANAAVGRGLETPLRPFS